jgi:Tfp pilus tip-associated adhesin PilY1
LHWNTTTKRKWDGKMQAYMLHQFLKISYLHTQTTRQTKNSSNQKKCICFIYSKSNKF